jgi:hypothetical protein
MNLHRQLRSIGFPNELNSQIAILPIDLIESFVGSYVGKALNRYSFADIQSTLDSDDNNAVIQYWTCIIEIGVFHTLHFGKLVVADREVHDMRVNLLAHALNFTLGKELKNRGFLRVPFIESEYEPIHLYFKWDNVTIIIERVGGIASQFAGADKQNVESYISNLVHRNLL